MIDPAHVHHQAHRRKLNGDRLSTLRGAIRKGSRFLGVAVAYRPSIGYVILGGEHRWAASVDLPQVECYVLRRWEDLVAWLAVDKADGRGLPFDPVAAVYMLEKAITALKPDRSQKVTQDFGEYTGWHKGILDNVRFAQRVVADPDEPVAVKDFLSARLRVLEDGGDGGHGLREALHKFRETLAAAERPRQSAAAQRKILEGSIPQLVGMIGALAELDAPHEDLPAKELEEYANQLGKLGAQLSRIKKNLRREGK